MTKQRRKLSLMNVRVFANLTHNSIAVPFKMSKFLAVPSKIKELVDKDKAVDPKWEEAKHM